MLEFPSAVSVLVSFALELKVGPAGGNGEEQDPDRRRVEIHPSHGIWSVRAGTATQRSTAQRRASRHMSQILGPLGMMTSLVTSKPWRPYKARFRSFDDSR